MRQKLKTIFTTLLVIAIPVVAIITLIHIYRSDDIVDVTNQTYVQEPLTVTENYIQISNLKARNVSIQMLEYQTYLLEQNTVIDLLKQVIGVENKVK